MRASVLGAGWVSGAGWGSGPLSARPGFPGGAVSLPHPSELFPKTPARWGRFDLFCKMGTVAAALALREADLWPDPEPGAGMVVASRWETTVRDREYYRTTLAEGGALSSPNLFSYTLPAALLGECAVAFGLFGPTFCAGAPEGSARGALRAAGLLLASGAAPRMLVARIEAPPAEEGLPSGALCLVVGPEGCGEGADLEELDLSL